jgi:hypothetical protein
MHLWTGWQDSKEWIITRWIFPLVKNGDRWHFLWGHSKFGHGVKRKNRLVE